MLKKRAGCLCGIALIMILLLSLASCSGPAPNKDKAPEDKRRFIIDSDSGADDAAALVLAAKDSGITIEGFTYDLEVPEDFDYDTTLVTEVDSTGYFDRYLEGIK